MKRYQYAFFDLFFTLITPNYGAVTEYDALNISREEWEFISEDKDLYRERVLGMEKNPSKIISKILLKGNIKISDNIVEKILEIRTQRFKNALRNIDQDVIDTLSNLKKAEIKLCLISNADVIDVKYWNKSKLAPYFEKVVFSFKYGVMKPQKGIYTLALKEIDACPNKSIFIGDGGDDELIGAKKVGMDTILAECYMTRQEKHFNRVADYCIDKFKDIEKILI